MKIVKNTNTERKVMVVAVFVIIIMGLVMTGCSSTPSTTPTDTPISTQGAVSTQVPGTEGNTGSKTFSKDDLKKYNGQNGNPAYVAVNGNVYDVSNVPQWKQGKHQGFQAGNDLTQEIMAAPHGLSTLQGIPIVGKLK